MNDERYSVLVEDLDTKAMVVMPDCIVGSKYPTVITRI
jgi:hypothetical protein